MRSPSFLQLFIREPTVMASGLLPPALELGKDGPHEADVLVRGHVSVLGKARGAVLDHGERGPSVADDVPLGVAIGMPGDTRLEPSARSELEVVLCDAEVELGVEAATAGCLDLAVGLKLKEELLLVHRGGGEKRRLHAAQEPRGHAVSVVADIL